jgi:hypothetical protein
MNDKNPADVAAQDQADAMFTDAMTADVIAKGIAYGGVVVGQTCRPSDEAIRDRFMEWIREQPTECPHRPLKGPMALWPAWQRQLMCAPCLNKLHHQVTGTPEDRRCDVCGVVQEPGPDVIQSCTYALQIKPLEDGTLVAPILLLYGRCMTCYGETP